MEKNYLVELSQMNSSVVARAIANEQRNIGTINNLHLDGIIVSYVLYIAATKKEVCLDSIEQFEKSYPIPLAIKDIIIDNIENVWNIIVELKNKFSAEQLLSFILFNNDLEDNKTMEYSTPNGLLKLATAILNIKKNDEVLELCSGKGNFPLEVYKSEDNFNYTGIELNCTANEIAKIRASLIGKNIRFILNDALEYRSESKADKIFSNYPFMIRTPSMNEHKELLIKSFGFPVDVIQRASSDWVFNATAVSQLKSNGKAVAIMTNGATWNVVDKNIRKYFIENGLIEAVISLPSRIFSSFFIPTTLVVFSNNNKAIKFVDAREICVKERRNNILTDECISEILDLLQNDGDKSITKSIDEFENDEYTLNASHYLEVVPEIKNGIELGSVTKNITRGAQIKATDLDELKSDESTQYKFLALSNISDGMLSIDDQYLKKIPSNIDKFCVKNNSIILSKIGTPEVKTAIVQIEGSTKLLATGNLYIIELDETKINPFYLQAFFASDTGMALLKSICVGSVLPTISLSKLKSLIIPVPPMENQYTIANKYAAKMDEVILLKRNLERSIAKLKHLYDEEAESC